MQEGSKEVDWNQGVQRQIQRGDMLGIDLRPFADKGFYADVLKQIRRGKEAGIDLDFYVKAGYDGEQLREIRVALRQGIALNDYLRADFCGAQLRQIRKGLWHRVDVSLYADVRYNWMQMKEIRVGLQNRVDASIYANPFYSYRQMQEIRLGLEDGIDIASYAKLLYSYTDMKKQRRKLTEELYEREDTRKDIVIVDEGTHLEIQLTDNRMKAYITFPSEHRKLCFNVDYVEHILRRNGVIYGIDRENIARAIREKRFDEKILVARGMEPKTGRDGQYEFFFKEPSRKPQELDDGRVDYQNVDIFVEVEKDQPIARYISPGMGAAGVCVSGMAIPGVKGKELPMLAGQGFRLLEDGVTYAAVMSGIIEYKEDEIHIYEALIIKEDVTASYGNINFHGCVHIHGNVGAGVNIWAEGSVSVEGTVEAAEIISGCDVLIKNGMIGAGKGSIRAMGNIAGNFFEAADLYAGGNIEAGYLMNSRSEACKNVVIMGRRGSIIGGYTRGIHGVEANNIGNRSMIATEIVTGAGQEGSDRVQKCQEKYEAVQSAILELTSRMGRFTNEEKQSVLYRKLLADQMKLKKQVREIQKERQKAQEALMVSSEIVVLSRAYEGTRLTIDQITMNLDEEYKMTTFCVEHQQIVCK